jgi:hypothetical protein
MGADEAKLARRRLVAMLRLIAAIDENSFTAFANFVSRVPPA